MRSPRAVPKGKTFRLLHNGTAGFSQKYTIMKADGSTVVGYLEAGDVADLILTDNATQNGTLGLVSTVFSKAGTGLANFGANRNSISTSKLDMHVDLCECEP